MEYTLPGRFLLENISSFTYTYHLPCMGLKQRELREVSWSLFLAFNELTNNLGKWYGDMKLIRRMREKMMKVKRDRGRRKRMGWGWAREMKDRSSKEGFQEWRGLAGCMDVERVMSTAMNHTRAALELAWLSDRHILLGSDSGESVVACLYGSLWVTFTHIYWA